jgi:Arc/MetJ-type ribon-helix-helix transcriptional regulator
MMHSVSTGRSNVVASRIGNEELKLIDTLIEARLFGTRSEAVAYLVSEGIKSRQDVFDKVSTSLEQIREIMREAEEHVVKLKEETGFAKAKDADETKEQKKACPECAKDLSNLPDDIVACPYCQTRLKQAERDTT